MSKYLTWLRSYVGHAAIINNGAALIITNENDEVLLQKRYKDKDIWGIIGGSMDYGESLEETAMREAREEIECDIQIEYLIGVYSKFFIECPNEDKVQAVTALFKAKIIRGIPKLNEEETFGLSYFPKNQLPQIDTHQLIFINDYFSGKVGIWK